MAAGADFWSGARGAGAAAGPSGLGPCSVPPQGPGDTSDGEGQARSRRSLQEKRLCSGDVVLAAPTLSTPQQRPASRCWHCQAAGAEVFYPVSASGCVISVCLSEVLQGMRLKQSALFACAEKCLQPAPWDAWVARGSGKRVWLPQSPARDAVLSLAQAAGSLPCPQGCPAGWARRAESGGHGGPWAAPTEELCTLGLSVPAEGR